MLVFGKHHEIRRRDEVLEVVTVLSRRQRAVLVGRGDKVLAIGWDWLKNFRNGQRFAGKVFLWFLLGRVRQGRFDLFRHQAIGAYLGILKDVGFVEADVEHSGDRASEINRQYKERVSSELATNVSFDSSVSLGVLNTKNLAVIPGSGRGRQRGRHSPSDADGAGPRTGAITQVACIDQSDRDSSGVGDGSRRLHDVTHGAIQADLSAADGALDFHDLGEALGIDLTLLHRKSVGQKLLKGFAIEVGRDVHAAAIPRRMPAYLDDKLTRIVAAYFIAAEHKKTRWQMQIPTDGAVSDGKTSFAVLGHHEGRDRQILSADQTLMLQR